MASRLLAHSRMGRHFVAAALVHLSAAACSIGPTESLVGNKPPDNKEKSPPPACGELDEEACTSDARCFVASCGSCTGGHAFIACLPVGTPGPLCPAFPCCGAYGLEMCLSAPSCHGVFAEDNGLACDCGDPGCCREFIRCEEGAFADCSGLTTCRQAPPNCGSDYLPSVGPDHCWEGCASVVECSPERGPNGGD